MGAYNIINCAITCPGCGRALEWQSKRLTYDGYLLANALQSIRLLRAMDGNMHAACDSCGVFLEAEIRRGQPGQPKITALPRPAVVGEGRGRS